MGWFKRAANSVDVPEVEISKSLDTPAFVCGETVTGTLRITSSETFGPKDIRIELQVIEPVQPLTTVQQISKESESPNARS